MLLLRNLRAGWRCRVPSTPAVLCRMLWNPTAPHQPLLHQQRLMSSENLQSQSSGKRSKPSWLRPIKFWCSLGDFDDPYEDMIHTVSTFEQVVNIVSELYGFIPHEFKQLNTLEVWDGKRWLPLKNMAGLKKYQHDDVSGAQIRVPKLYDSKPKL